MADRNMYPVRANGTVHTLVSFAFAPNGTVDPGISGEGCASWVDSIVHTSTGVWTITLSDSWPALVSALADLQMVSATDLKLQWGAIDVVTAKTLVLRALAVATPTDITADAANKIFVTLVLRNSTVTP